MRAGVFLCQCGGNISGVIDLPALAEKVKHLDGVSSVAISQFMCGTEGHDLIAKAVEDRGLDHLVVASCSPRFQGPTFERIARELKLGENAVSFANIREGCSFVHRHEPEAAQEKAATIVAGAVARAQHQHDLPRRRTFLHKTALVVGGGIAGMTAAEELAASGLDVHLVERQQSLGGYMARLSKTFPTEDCAMCSLAPRLTSTALDGRIHVHTLTEVDAISGPPGAFRVTLRHKPRFVSEACVGCGECAAVCPVTYSSEFEFGVAPRTAISRPFTGAVPATFAIEKKGWSPCKSACAVHTSVQGYVALVAAGRFDEAYRIAAERNPFPSVCGRVCGALCESACARGKVDDPIALAAIERCVADTVGPAQTPKPAPIVHAERVAVVGAGPAGLTCARELAHLGYAVTVFEALPVAGGMLRAGIPDYRLPHDVIAREVDQIIALGVDLRLNQRAGADFTVDGLLAEGYGAVYLAPGLQQGAAAQLPGAELAHVVQALAFLREVNLGSPSSVGKHVVVLGGGRSALAAARSALRLHLANGDTPDVTLVHGEATVERAALDDLTEARAEGVRVELLAEPVRIHGDGVVSSVTFRRGAPDTHGAASPQSDAAGSSFDLVADTVILALGEVLADDVAQGCDGLKLADGRIATERDTMMTTREGVFSGGDATATRRRSVIEAIAAGRRGAAAIHNYLRGARLLPVQEESRRSARPDAAALERVDVARRVAAPTIDMHTRGGSVAEITAGLTPEQAMAEARRCLNCAVCSDCNACATVCPSGAIDRDQTETTEEVTVGAVILATGHQEFDATRKAPLGYGRYRNVLTQSQLSRLLAASGPTAGELLRPSDGARPKRIFMLQCVGSRDCTATGNEHCSAICCLFATLHASLIRQHDPETEVTIAYTDLRAPGKAHEEYYRLVQSRGVRYVRGRVGEILEEKDGSLRVRVEDTMTGRKHEELFDLVVLSAGLEGSQGTRDIARVAGLQTAAAGFIREYHPKLRPVDTQRTGMFVAGTAQGPKTIPESIAQAKAAAARTISMLSRGFALTPAQVAASDPDVCIGCGVCASVCPQLAVTLTGGAASHSTVDATVCRGCGICVAECPTGAIQLGGFSDAELLAEATV